MWWEPECCLPALRIRVVAWGKRATSEVHAVADFLVGKDYMAVDGRCGRCFGMGALVFEGRGRARHRVWLEAEPLEALEVSPGFLTKCLLPVNPVSARCFAPRLAS